MRLSTPLSAAALCLALVATGAVFAADKPRKEAAFGKGGGSGPMLTRDQLRACIAQNGKLTQQQDELAKEQATLLATKDELARSGVALKDKLERVDRTNAEAVAAYNDEAQARDKQIDDYQARVTAFNARAEAGQTEREAFSKACENRRYFEDDEIAIKKGK